MVQGLCILGRQCLVVGEEDAESEEDDENEKNSFLGGG